MTNKIVDRQALLDEFENDLEIILGAFEIFQIKSPSILKKLETSIFNRDYKIIESLAHELKGASSNFFCPQLVNNLQLIEHLGRTNQDDNLDTLINQAKAYNHQLIEEMLKLQDEYQKNRIVLRKDKNSVGKPSR